MVGWRIVLWAVLVVAALAFLFLVRSVLLPFILAFIVAAVLDPMIQRLRNHGWSKGLAIHAVFFGFILVGLVFGAWLIPVVGNQVSTMRDKFQVLVTTLTSPNRNDNFFVRWNPVVQVQQSESDNRVDRFLDQNRNLLDRLGLPTKSHVYMEKYVEPRRGEIGKAIETFFSGFLGIASGIASQMFLLLFTPLLAYMMLLDMDQFKRKSMMLIPPSIRSSATTILKDIGTVFMHYLRGVTIAVLGYMAVMSTLFTVLGAPYSILLGIIVGAVYLIPYLNGLISVTLLFTLTGLSSRTDDLFFHFQSPWAFAAFVSAMFFATHFVYDSLVYPRLVGRSVGLHPVVSMFVIFSGGVLGGLVGMIIAFPLAGAVKVILDRLLGVAVKSSDSLDLPAVPQRHRRAVAT